MAKQREVIFITNYSTISLAEYILTLCTMMETASVNVTTPDKIQNATDKNTDAA